MDYSDLVDNESSPVYIKHHKALLELIGVDVVRTTQILDILAEIRLLSGYQQ